MGHFNEWQDCEKIWDFLTNDDDSNFSLGLELIKASVDISTDRKIILIQGVMSTLSHNESDLQKELKDLQTGSKEFNDIHEMIRCIRHKRYECSEAIVDFRKEKLKEFLKDSCHEINKLCKNIIRI